MSLSYNVSEQGNVMNKDKNLVGWMSTFSDYGGYADMSRTYVKNLVNDGWKVGIELIKSTWDWDETEAEFYNNLRNWKINGSGNREAIAWGFDYETKQTDRNTVKIVAHLPLPKIPRFGHNVIYSMMECRKVAPFFVKCCNDFYDSMWTPTEYNKNVFLEAGLKIPINVLPIIIKDDLKPENSIDDMKFNYKVFGPPDSPKFPEGFKFLSVFRWSYRKGFDVLIKSYLREFKKSDNVSLIIFSRHSAMSHAQNFYNSVERDFHEMVRQYGGPDAPPIYWCSDVVAPDMMPSLYRTGNVFVNCSRGEGFSIPTLEASKLGIPIIVPKHTAFLDYINDENCLSYDVDTWKNTNDVPSWRVWRTEYFAGQEFPLFGESVSENVSHLMRYSMNHYEEVIEKNNRLKSLIIDKYSTEACMKKINQYLVEM